MAGESKTITRGSAGEVIVIADDLTGALDSAVAFATRGMSVVASCTPASLLKALTLGADVVALSTGTRALEPEAARAVLEGVAPQLRTHRGILFKKIDSRMQGNVRAETGVLAKFRTGPVLACPAIPRLGRVVRNGAVCGAGVDRPIAIGGYFQALDACIVDAQTDAEIDSALSGIDSCRLLVGAAGLAEGLARHLRPEFNATSGVTLKLPALMAIGSRDAVTIGQIAALSASGLPIGRTLAVNGAVPAIGGDAAIELVQMVGGDVAIAPQLASQHFATGIAARVLSNRPETLFISGGDSAGAILKELAIDLLKIDGEILPGVPSAVALDGVRGLRIVTKSGGFGQPQILAEFCAALLES